MKKWAYRGLDLSKKRAPSRPPQRTDHKVEKSILKLKGKTCLGAKKIRISGCLDTYLKRNLSQCGTVHDYNSF